MAGDSYKRLRTDPEKKSCNLIQMKTKDAPAFDIVLKQEFLEIACKCEKCQKMLAQLASVVKAIESRDEDAARLERNLNGDVNPETTITTVSPKQDLENVEELLCEGIKGLPFEAQAYAVTAYG